MSNSDLKTQSGLRAELEIQERNTATYIGHMETCQGELRRISAEIKRAKSLLASLSEEKRMWQGIVKDVKELTKGTNKLKKEIKAELNEHTTPAKRTRKRTAPVQCSICLLRIVRVKATRRTLSCGHQFHISCIDQWLGGAHHTCPMCRAPVAP